ncbi:hypothetical protein PM8797T_00237 [Gimesia maris DSM 8797]|uniref:Uncharacterized protein n=1 Tax=Gimesia maris TaxID=122 RepID=A0ABX5YL98_9PLAN|nr:hypothetical protein PM8797T_00237 [Gimesia maris DSM 8797]QDT78979.1 hypothetical protein Mal35_24320 [Gimesia maris]QDU14511.1 hypothetical protein CA11_23190 [Gimesia maris]QEG16493.1 hypothetical protein GmarT_23580 [Gimesia maris]
MIENDTWNNYQYNYNAILSVNQNQFRNILSERLQDI